ncbi:MAG: hypothetical protein QOF02_3289 [Blastocatellia bacterium]|jgi:hypothetical protein|nr:hypothetical protein [Blastocatellia bacterium]
MFSQHINKQLSAYCHGELDEAEARRVAEHLIGCQRCRRDFEEIKLGVRFAEQLTTDSAPASMWTAIEAALQERPRTDTTRAKPARRRFEFNGRPVAAACAVLLVALAVGAFWLYTRQPNNAVQIAGSDKRTNTAQSEVKPALMKPQASAGGSAWEVARLEGSPMVGATQLDGSGRLAVGQWLETDNASRARINVANIGQVEIEPNSRVQLVETNAQAHRLSLMRGRLEATISAPPRLFMVDTPSGVAVDLGCAYTLEVDDAGRSVLHVTAGWVALELKGRESLVPAGAVCVTLPGAGPGTPYFDDASPRFRRALARLDSHNGSANDLSIILREAREYDTLTLWHLLSRVEGAERERVYERMAALVTPPQGVNREGIMRLDKGMLDLWQKDLEWAWFE